MSDCIFEHDVDMLFDVPPKPVSKLVTHCICGERIRYGPTVLFVITEPRHLGLAEDETATLAKSRVSAYCGEIELRDDELRDEVYRRWHWLVERWHART